MSVLEVLVAMALLAMAGLGIIAALTRVMLAQDTSSTQTVARLLAEGVVQNAILLGDGASYEERLVSALVGQGATSTNFRIEKPKFTILGDETVMPGRHRMGRFQKVSVKVWWDEASDSSQTGVERGRQSVEVVRFVYLET